MAIILALVLTVLLGFAALVIDVGSLFRVRGELQNAADSAALAGAQELDRSLAGIARSQAQVLDFGRRHQANSTPVTIQASDIVFGFWHYDVQPPYFQPYGPSPTEAEAGSANAVQVTGRRAAATSDPVRHYFAPLIGRDQSDVSATAIAVGGGPFQECAFPMTVADCALDTPIENNTCEYCMRFQDNNTDNAGWTGFAAQGQVSPVVIRDLIKENCLVDGQVAVDPSTGECLGQCRKIDVGTDIQVANGNMMNQGNNNFCPLIKDILRRGSPNGQVQPFTVRIPVLQSESSSCDGQQFSGKHAIAGFAALDILGAKCGNGDKKPALVHPLPAPCDIPHSDKYVVARLRCDMESGQPAGGGYFGMDARHVRLVQ